MFEDRFRIVVLILATGCLSMMLANILTLNFVGIASGLTFSARRPGFAFVFVYLSYL